MPVTVTKTIKSSGGDYTSLSAWEAANQGDLVTADEIRQAECYAFTDTTACVIDGSTTDATRYLRVYTPSAERHAGVFDSSKYNITLGTDFVRPLRVLDDFVRIEGLQLHQSGTGVNAYGAMEATGPATSDIRVEACILRSSTSSTHDSNGATMSHGGGSLTIRNTVIVGGRNGVYTTFSASAPTLVAQNCTIVASLNYGSFRGSGTPAYTNCYNGGHTTDSYSGAFTATTCAHSSATVYTGSTASVAYSTANFTSVTAGSENLHLVTGSALIDVGTDLSGTFTVDIDGATRSGTWDIGADEFASAVAARQQTLTLIGVGA